MEIRKIFNRPGISSSHHLYSLKAFLCHQNTCVELFIWSKVFSGTSIQINVQAPHFFINEIFPDGPDGKEDCDIMEKPDYLKPEAVVVRINTRMLLCVSPIIIPIAPGESEPIDPDDGEVY